MILIVGGAFQGKRALALSLSGLRESDVTDGALCTQEALYCARILVNFETYLRRFPEEGEDADVLADRLAQANPDLILCCREVGSGIIPMDARESAWRERCGRCCTAAARRSSRVYRVICGIPQMIKCEEQF